MKINLYNSNTKSKELFVPIDPKKVTMYVCGPTVYSYPHIGNARGPVIFDVLARLLRMKFDLIYVRNITDLDDKIYQAADEEGVHISEVTQRYTKIYQEDMSALGVEKPETLKKNFLSMVYLVGHCILLEGSSCYYPHCSF